MEHMQHEELLGRVLGSTSGKQFQSNVTDGSTDGYLMGFVSLDVSVELSLVVDKRAKDRNSAQTEVMGAPKIASHGAHLPQMVSSATLSAFLCDIADVSSALVGSIVEASSEQVANADFPIGYEVP